jgi:hypothetical protein
VLNKKKVLSCRRSLHRRLGMANRNPRPDLQEKASLLSRCFGVGDIFGERFSALHKIGNDKCRSIFKDLKRRKHPRKVSRL